MYKAVKSAQTRRKKAEGNSKDGLFPTLNTRARTDAHISQAKLAEKLGITTSTLVNYEKGRTPIKADILIKYSQICQVSTDYLLGLSNCKNIENAQIQKKIGINEKSIAMLESHVEANDNAKIKTLDFLLRENHMKPIRKFFSGKGIKGANDTGLLNLITHYLVGNNDDEIENLPCITSNVEKGSSLEIDGKVIAEAVLIKEIELTLIKYKEEITKKREKKKGSL